MSQALEAQPITSTPADLLRLPQTLTIKQRLFIHYYIETRNATRSAELAGYSGDAATLATVGWDNLRKPEIKNALDEIWQQKIASSSQVLVETSEIAMTPVSELASDVNPSPIRATDKLKALELMGKHHRVFVDKVETESTLSGNDIDRLGQSLLAAMTEAAQRMRAAEAQPVAQLGESDPNL